MYRRNVLISTLMLTMLVATLAVASVFAYYPLTIRAVPAAPGVKFEAGSNAGQPDIGTESITVTIGDNETSASVTIHPTYGECYYKDVLRIKNEDNNAMNVWLVFTSLSNTLPSGSVVKVFFYLDATKVKEFDITSPDLNTPISVGAISATRTWQVDFYVSIPEGENISGKSYTASAKLVYSPSAETPPATPSEGR